MSEKKYVKQYKTTLHGSIRNFVEQYKKKYIIGESIALREIITEGVKSLSQKDTKAPKP